MTKNQRSSGKKKCITYLLGHIKQEAFQIMMLKYKLFTVMHITSFLYGDNYTDSQRKGVYKTLNTMIKEGTIVKYGSSYHLTDRLEYNLQILERIRQNLPSVDAETERLMGIRNDEPTYYDYLVYGQANYRRKPTRS